MSRTLRVTFLIHLLVAFVFGLVMFASPALWSRIANYAPIDPTVTRVLGAALLGLGFSSWLGYRARRWEEVRITVEMEIEYTVLATVALLYLLWAGVAPLFAWVPLVCHVAFAVAFVYLYWQQHAATKKPGVSTSAPFGSAPATGL